MDRVTIPGACPFDRKSSIFNQISNNSLRHPVAIRKKRLSTFSWTFTWTKF